MQGSRRVGEFVNYFAQMQGAAPMERRFLGYTCSFFAGKRDIMYEGQPPASPNAAGHVAALADGVE